MQSNIAYKNIINNKELIKQNQNIPFESTNEEYFKQNYDTVTFIQNNKNIFELKSNTNKPNSYIKNINNIYHESTIPKSIKAPKKEIENINKLLILFKEEKPKEINKYYGPVSKFIKTEELEKKKENLSKEIKRLKQKNKELISLLGSDKHILTDEEIENKEKMDYIKYLYNKSRDFVYQNNELKSKFKSKNINIKQKLEYLLNKQIKEYENILSLNDSMNDIKNKNVQTNYNQDNYELSLSGEKESDYKLNNVKTDGHIINKNRINNFDNNSIGYYDDFKNKNTVIKSNKNNSKQNYLSSLNYLKNSKNARNNNKSSSIIGSHELLKKNEINQK